jgi:hypothetical protein
VYKPAPSSYPIRPATFDTAWCKQTNQECGCHCCEPPATARDAFDSDVTQDLMVSVVLFHLQKHFSIDIANNVIENTQRVQPQPYLMQQ